MDRAGTHMTDYVALLRAVNVGGTGKLPMSTLLEFCRTLGFSQAQTYIASGNVVFRSDRTEGDIRLALEAQLLAHAGRPVCVVVRSAAEITGVLARNPYADRPPNRVMALFTDSPLPDNPLHGAKGMQDEQLSLGLRELFVFYPNGMASTRLHLPAHDHGTSRNMNTVAKLCDLVSRLL